MAQRTENDQDQALERELAGLKQEYERLREQKFHTEANLANLERQLQELETQAREEYGTADPEELERLLQQRREENARLVAEYRQHIQDINNGLAAIEQEEGQQ